MEIFMNICLTVVFLLLMVFVVALLFIGITLAFAQMKTLGIEIPRFSLKPFVVKDVPVHLVKFNTLEDQDQIGILFKSGKVYDTCNKKWIKKSHFKVSAAYEVEECLKE